MASVLDIFARGRRGADIAAFEKLMEAAYAWKPSGFDGDVSRRRDYFRGDQEKWVKKDLERRYPKTAKYMNPYCTPIVRHLIEQQATIWKSPPTRVAVNCDQRLLDLIYSETAVDAHLQYAEECAVAAGVAFVRASWDVYDERAYLDVYWADKVNVVCNPERPDRLDLASAVIVTRVPAAGVSSDKGRWEVWSNQGDGTWQRIDIFDDGKTWSYDQAVYKRLPIVALYAGRPGGVMFSPVAMDDVSVNNSADAIMSDLLYTISMQTAPQVTYIGRDQGRTLEAGPQSIWSATDGQFGVLNYQPLISQVKDTARDLISQLLVLRGVSPSQASADPRYESGVSLKVQQAPMLEKRASRIPFAREFEERRLFPLLRDVWEAGGGESLGEGAEIKWTAGELQLPLDDEAEMRVMQGQIALGMLTVEDWMVRRGISRSIVDAQEKRKQNLDALKQNPVDWLVPFIKGEAPQPEPAKVAEEGADADEPA